MTEITVFGISYIAEDNGDVFNVPTPDLPGGNLSLGQRIQFQVDAHERVVNIQLIG